MAEAILAISLLQATPAEHVYPASQHCSEAACYTGLATDAESSQQSSAGHAA